MTMATLHVRTILSDPVLVSRESARQLTEAIQILIAASSDAEVVIDFQGVAGVAPSFLDELLTVFESIVGTANGRQLIIANPPTRLSSKFEAVARGHKFSVRPGDDGTWVLAPAA